MWTLTMAKLLRNGVKVKSDLLDRGIASECIFIYL